MYIVREMIDEILENELPGIEKGKRDLVSSDVCAKINKIFKDYEYNQIPVNATKSSYKGVPIVEYDYLEGTKNHVELNGGCAIRTRKGLCIIGQIIKIKDEYMIIRTAELGEVKIEYSLITGMFPCGLPDNYFES